MSNAKTVPSSIQPAKITLGLIGLIGSFELMASYPQSMAIQGLALFVLIPTFGFLALGTMIGRVLNI